MNAFLLFRCLEGRERRVGEEENGSIRGKMGIVAATEFHGRITLLDWKHNICTWRRIYMRIHTHTHTHTLQHRLTHTLLPTYLLGVINSVQQCGAAYNYVCASLCHGEHASLIYCLWSQKG